MYSQLGHEQEYLQDDLEGRRHTPMPVRDPLAIKINPSILLADNSKGTCSISVPDI